MNATNLILQFAKGYCEEALGNDIYLSETFLSEDIINSLFESKEKLKEIYELGKLARNKHKTEVFYTLKYNRWLTYPNNWTISITHLGVLLEDWDFVNQFQYD